MARKARWIEGVITESGKPGIEMPWTSKRNTFAGMIAVRGAMVPRRIRLDLRRTAARPTQASMLQALRHIG